MKGAWRSHTEQKFYVTCPKNICKYIKTLTNPNSYTLEILPSSKSYNIQSKNIYIEMTKHWYSAIVHSFWKNIPAKYQQRIQLYNIFKTTRDFNVIFLSKVRDTAIDLPCANVAIQLGTHFKSRKQEVQRMGRIMRAKDNPNNQYNVFFYTLVSMNTQEVGFSRIRQKCLVDQGFQYEIVTEKQLNFKEMKMQQINEQLWLNKLLSQHTEGNHLLNLQNLKKTLIKTKCNYLTEKYYLGNKVSV